MDDTSKKTICIFSTFYLPNYSGVEKFTSNLARELVSAYGCRVIVVTSALDGNAGITEEDGVAVVRIPSHLLLNDRFAAPKRNGKFHELMRWLDKQPIDYILINQRFYPTSLFGMKYAKKRGVVPLVLDHGSAHLTMANPFLDFFVQRYEHMITNRGKRFGNRYIAVSSTSAEWLKHFDIDAVGVTNNSINADDFIEAASTRDFRNELGVSNDGLLVVFTGRLMKEKGLLQLCAAIKKLNDWGFGDIHLAIAGSGPLGQEILDADIKNIHLVGKLGPEDIAALLLRGDIFCLPTVSEGFSTSMLEAAVAGMGIIITETGGVHELLTGDDCGIVLEDDEPDTVAKAILRFYNDREYLARCGTNVAARVRDSFTWNKAAEDLLRLFEQNPMKTIDMSR